MNKKIISLTIIVLCICTLTAQKKEIVVYYPEWGPAYRNYNVKNIETSGTANKITVLNFAFVEPAPDSSGNIIAKFMDPFLDYQQVYSTYSSIDGIADDSTQSLRGQFNQLRKLKTLHPNLKILISIGGWTGSRWFSDAARSPQSREYFVDDCINKFINGNLPANNNSGGKGVAKGIFDGFDIDWEFPVNGGDEAVHHDKFDSDNLSALLSLFRKKLDNIKPGLLLTSALPAGVGNLWKFNLLKDQACIDWYNIMTYDFHGTWDSKTGHHTNLFSTPGDSIFNSSKESFAGSVSYLIDSVGLNPKKIIPGAASYARGWKVTGLANHGLFQSGSVAMGLSEMGFNDYKYLSSLINNAHEYHWDNNAMAPWLFSPKDSTFWTFDDPVSVALKIRFVYAHNLKGLMLWEISGDDSVGTLVNTISSGNLNDIKLPGKLKSTNTPIVSLAIQKESKNIYSGTDVLLKINEIKLHAPLVKVEYFVDNSSIGFNTKAPFSWVWFNVPKGKHKLNVIATDSVGNKKNSKRLSVNIK
jgi:chitinase